MGTGYNSLATEIQAIMAREKAIAWIGSGLSMGVGNSAGDHYPSWPEAIRALCERCSVAPPTESELDDEQSLMDLAENCKLASQDAYLRYLHYTYSKSFTITRQVYTALVAVDFAGIVTTNIDPLLWDAVRPRFFQLRKYSNLPVHTIGDRRTPIFYPHKTAARIRPTRLLRWTSVEELVEDAA